MTSPSKAAESSWTPPKKISGMCLTMGTPFLKTPDTLVKNPFPPSSSSSRACAGELRGSLYAAKRWMVLHFQGCYLPLSEYLTGNITALNCVTTRMVDIKEQLSDLRKLQQNRSRWNKFRAREGFSCASSSLLMGSTGLIEGSSERAYRVARTS